MHVGPHPDPYHANIHLEGGDKEVVHIRAFGKDMQIEIRIDESKTGVVIVTPDGVRRWAIPGRGDDR